MCPSPGRHSVALVVEELGARVASSSTCPVLVARHLSASFLFRARHILARNAGMEACHPAWRLRHYYKQRKILELPLMMRLWTCGQRPCVVHMPTGSGSDRAAWHGPALRYVTEYNGSRLRIAVPRLRPDAISGMVHASGWMILPPAV